MEKQKPEKDGRVSGGENHAKTKINDARWSMKADKTSSLPQLFTLLFVIRLTLKSETKTREETNRVYI